MLSTNPGSKLKTSLVLLAAIAFAPSLWAQQTIAGLWSATVTVSGNEIPFKIGFSGDGDNIKGWFFNGDQHENSTGGKFENGSLVLNFDSYASVLKATLKNGVLEGEYGSTARPAAVTTGATPAAPAGRAGRGGGGPLPFRAVRYVPEPPSNVKAPDISGLWYLENIKSSKHDEKAWQFFVEQKGAEVSGAILRVDGDTGTLSGSYKDGKFVLSHFSGARGSLLVVTPQSDGTLTLELDGQHPQTGAIVGVRPEQARAKGLDLPVDFNLHTSVTDPSKPFTFSYPDLSGKIVSNTDPRFQGKVVLINVTGSWCPNCHDEAPFLAALYDKYHAQGLEIVALDFEQGDEQLTNPVRLRQLIKQSGIKYTVLLGGLTGTAKGKLTQARDWDTWPATFFVGRDGLVKAVHSGFPSPGSGKLYKDETDEVVAKVEQLLGQNLKSSK
jgi:thiol-disulfide isomerase/thioredoxin